MNSRMLPFVGFVLLFALLGAGLLYVRDHDTSEVPSPLVGKPAPAFSLPVLNDPGRIVDSRSFRGKPYLLHVFASWCYVCREENAVLMTEGKRMGVPLIGFDYKDEPSDATAWLKRFGDPYDVVLADLEGDVAIDLGVYGAPELFLIDAQGVIRYKHIGALTSEVVETKLMPIIGTMAQESSK